MDEFYAALGECRIATNRASLRRFFNHHDLSHKNRAQPRFEAKRLVFLEETGTSDPL